ncbi:orotidine-5'-phosphate decarboxylase [Salinibacillus xinjiangensis]|uniref:Orotidine 5'-phosphate decarboxylase n=1 Tax=Salinibacillus xinjiangensis TaxID=1229268 RepID=A0A6G1X3D6_9BACI|nr:orotidine-5'-phosphate decarboxylase [Salinibacillus xinjiangensis]MRG85462.1 orotidine-5'-phosphate decarboxylase [Salinibacillus xinjiangensis]
MIHPLYVALDFPTYLEVETFLQENDLGGIPVKIGMELFYREGPQVVEQLKRNQHPIFLDLKLHDIPNTVKSAMKNLASLSVDMVNIHAAGGSEMISAAREGLEMGTYQGKDRPILLAVTQLTSTDERMIKEELGIQWSMNKTVENYGRLAQTAGADGVVCSVHESATIKRACGRSFLTCTPGIRFQEDLANDQKRVATPKEAKIQGSDMLVMGRSITNAQKPKQRYERVVREWENE